MAGITFPNIAGTLAPLMQLDLAAERNAFDRERATKADEAAAQDREDGKYLGPALQGDKAAQARVMSNPKYAPLLSTHLERLDKNQRAKIEEDAKFITSNGMAILNAAPEAQPGLYARVRQEAQAAGRDVSTWPTQYDPGWVKFNVDKAMTAAEYYKRQGDGVQYVDGGGQGGPAPGGFSGQVAKDESGGNYNIPNAKGSGAYGKYQFMPETWATVAQANPNLNLPLNMRQATPQQQEAAMEAFTRANGQVLQSAGIPATPDNLYLAHRFGADGARRFLSAPDNTPIAQVFPPKWIEQNPDLNTTVGQFKRGVQARYGGITAGREVDVAAGPSGPGPQVAQGDNTRADGSGNPIQTTSGDLVPRDIMKSITPLLQPGTALGIDNKTKQYKVQDGHFIVYDMRTSMPVGLIPVPKPPKEQGAGPFAGNSVEAQALNMMIANGTLTPQQAAELAAGKTITNPADGSVVFMTPSGIFGQRPGQAPQPVAGPAPGPQAAPAAPAQGPAVAPAPSGMPAPTGTPAGVIPITGPKPVKPEQMTEGQAKAYGFAQRMATANALLDDLAIQGTSKKGRFLEALPGGVGNLAQSPEFQRFEQARANFLNAQLRDESGAVIGPSEFMSADKQYFPQPGQATNKELLAQMAENRRQVVEAMMIKAGMLKRGERYDPPAKAVDGAEKGRLIFEARQAIKDGRDPNGVREKLKKLGVDPAELDGAN